MFRTAHDWSLSYVGGNRVACVLLMFSP